MLGRLAPRQTDGVAADLLRGARPGGKEERKKDVLRAHVLFWPSVPPRTCSLPIDPPHLTGAGAGGECRAHLGMGPAPAVA